MVVAKFNIKAFIIEVSLLSIQMISSPLEVGFGEDDMVSTVKGRLLRLSSNNSYLSGNVVGEVR